MMSKSSVSTTLASLVYVSQHASHAVSLTSSSQHFQSPDHFQRTPQIQFKKNLDLVSHIKGRADMIGSTSHGLRPMRDNQYDRFSAPGRALILSQGKQHGSLQEYNGHQQYFQNVNLPVNFGGASRSHGRGKSSEGGHGHQHRQLDLNLMTPMDEPFNDVLQSNPESGLIRVEEMIQQRSQPHSTTFNQRQYQRRSEVPVSIGNGSTVLPPIVPPLGRRGESQHGQSASLVQGGHREQRREHHQRGASMNNTLNTINYNSNASGAGHNSAAREPRRGNNTMVQTPVKEDRVDQFKIDLLRTTVDVVDPFERQLDGKIRVKPVVNVKTKQTTSVRNASNANHNRNAAHNTQQVSHRRHFSNTQHVSQHLSRHSREVPCGNNDLNHILDGDISIPQISNVHKRNVKNSDIYEHYNSMQMHNSPETHRPIQELDLEKFNTTMLKTDANSHVNSHARTGSASAARHPVKDTVVPVIPQSQIQYAEKNANHGTRSNVNQNGENQNGYKQRNQTGGNSTVKKVTKQRTANLNTKKFLEGSEEFEVIKDSFVKESINASSGDSKKSGVNGVHGSMRNTTNSNSDKSASNSVGNGTNSNGTNSKGTNSNSAQNGSGTGSGKTKKTADSTDATNIAMDNLNPHNHQVRKSLLSKILKKSPGLSPGLQRSDEIAEIMPHSQNILEENTQTEEEQNSNFKEMNLDLAEVGANAGGKNFKSIIEQEEQRAEQAREERYDNTQGTKFAQNRFKKKFVQEHRPSASEEEQDESYARPVQTRHAATRGGPRRANSKAIQKRCAECPPNWSLNLAGQLGEMPTLSMYLGSAERKEDGGSRESAEDLNHVNQNVQNPSIMVQDHEILPEFSSPKKMQTQKASSTKRVKFETDSRRHEDENVHAMGQTGSFGQMGTENNFRQTQTKIINSVFTVDALNEMHMQPGRKTMKAGMKAGVNTQGKNAQGSVMSPASSKSTLPKSLQESTQKNKAIMRQRRASTDTRLNQKVTSPRENEEHDAEVTLDAANNGLNGAPDTPMNTQWERREETNATIASMAAELTKAVDRYDDVNGMTARKQSMKDSNKHTSPKARKAGRVMTKPEDSPFLMKQEKMSNVQKLNKNQVNYKPKYEVNNMNKNIQKHQASEQKRKQITSLTNPFDKLDLNARSSNSPEQVINTEEKGTMGKTAQFGFPQFQATMTNMVYNAN